MQTRVIRSVLALCLMCAISPLEPLWAQGRRPPAKSATSDKQADKQLCVDIASMRQGKSARGLIVPLRFAVSPDDVVMIVEREELERDNPALYAKAARAEAEMAGSAWTQLQERLDKELTNDKLSEPLKVFYQQQRDRAAAQRAVLKPDQLLDTRFMWLDLRSKEIANLRRSSPEARRIAIWAWHEKLVDVTRRSQTELQRELDQDGVMTSLKLPDLSKQMAPRTQSDQEWAVRLALIRFWLDNGLEFQGSNGIYLRSGTQMQAADMAALVQKMMGGNLEALLADLDPAAKAASKQKRDDWYQNVVSQVEGEGRTEFRITRLEQDPTGQAATVETALVAKLPSKSWQIIWSSKQTVPANQVNAQAEKQITEDPQVQAALSALSILGAGAEAEIKKAVRFGAATQAAQQLADAAFFEFRDTYDQRLDGPPL